MVCSVTPILLALPSCSAAQLLEHSSVILLRQGADFLGDPQQSKNWPAGKMGLVPGAHRIMAEKSGYIRSGDLVRIKCNAAKTTSPGYEYMYSSDAGWIYYDQDNADNPKQWWLIEKANGRKGEVITDGDAVTFRNKNWPTAGLYAKDGWAACDYGQNPSWTVSLYPKAVTLPLRVHIMTGLDFPHATGKLSSWFGRSDVDAVMKEVNLIWSQANIQWKVESIVLHTNQGSDSDLAYVSAATRTLVGDDRRSDPARIPRIYNCFDSTKHRSDIQNIYFFPFTGNTSQGYAGDPNNQNGRLADSNYVVVGTWTNKYTNGGAPVRTAIREDSAISNKFSVGSLGHTCAHELGHNLGLAHTLDSNSTKYGRLMGGESPKGYKLTWREINSARSEALDRK